MAMLTVQLYAKTVGKSNKLLFLTKQQYIIYYFLFIKQLF